jgi:hypothetical protein
MQPDTGQIEATMEPTAPMIEHNPQVAPELEQEP